MEINKLNELYTKLEQKYSFGDIDANKDGQITEQEVLTLAYKDEELRAELSSYDIESISEFINIDETSSVNQNSSVNSTVKSSLLSNISTSDIQQLIVYLCTLLLSKNVDSTTLLNSLQNILSESTTSSSQETSQTQARMKCEVKTMDEYTEILNNKFDELEKEYGNTEDVYQYVKNNMKTFMDITGDGRIDQLDFFIYDNYLRTLKGSSLTGIKKSVAEIRNTMHRMGLGSVSDTNSYDLDDLENYVKLGANPSKVYYLLNNCGDKTKIAQTENWESRIDSLGIKAGSLGGIKKSIQSIADYIENHPENAKFAQVALAYQNYISNEDYYKLQAEAQYENNKLNYEIYMKDSSYYKSFKKGNSDCNWTKEKFAYEWAYGDAGSSLESTLKYVKNSCKTSLVNSLKNNDINGDGKLDINDLMILCTDIDLDGDGQISKEERDFISELKQSSATLYINYIKKSSLSKEQLMEILNKINSASSSVQSKLAHVKAVVQEKLNEL